MTMSRQTCHLFLAAALLSAVATSARGDVTASPREDPRDGVGRTQGARGGDELRASAPEAPAAAAHRVQMGPREDARSGGGYGDFATEPRRSANFTERELELIQHGP